MWLIGTKPKIQPVKYLKEYLFACLCVSFTAEFAIQYSGKDLVEVQWNTSMYEEAIDKVCQNFMTDTFPVKVLRYPLVYKLMGSRNWIMGSNGIIQHPEVEGLLMQEYDDFIASPYDCLVEKILPRLYPELDKLPGNKAITLSKAFKAWFDESAIMGQINAKLAEKYGLAGGLSSGACEAPLDYVADQLRGFKGSSTDVRRVPDKVAAAAEAATPMMVKMGTPRVKFKHGATFMPLHMPPYIRDKDFEKLYWPSFKKVVETLAEAGQPAYLFLEQDWMRYLDYLNELPENTRMRFEYGDPKLVKEKLGRKHIVSGFYPLVLLKTGSKQQCVDKAKELIDILAPGGRYFFELDKIPLTVDSVNVENLQAVLEYVSNNTEY